MTIHEWRFRSDRFDYELKFTVETDRYDGLKPQMIRCFESFAEIPVDEPGNEKRNTGENG